MRFEIARARAYYTAGLPGIFLLPPNCRLGILLAARLYAAILGCIERQRYDVFSRRAATSLPEKVLMAGTSYLSLRIGGWLSPVDVNTASEVVVA
jgi:15-cis-phytoene synthase